MNAKHEWTWSANPPVLPYRGMHSVELAVAICWWIRCDRRPLVPPCSCASLTCREKRSSSTWDCRQVTVWVMQPCYSVPSPLSPLNVTRGPGGQYGVCCEDVMIVMRNQYSVHVGSKWIKESQGSMKGEKKMGGKKPLESMKLQPGCSRTFCQMAQWGKVSV